MKIKYLFISIIFLSILSCGFPDASSIYVNLNQPYITRVSPGENELTIYFEAQNNEINFSGYNVYYGDDVYQKIYTIYDENDSKPTISASKSETVQQYEYTISIGANYSNTNGNTGRLQNSDLANGYPRYIVVTAYDLFNNQESSLAYDHFVALGIPRPELLNQTISVNGRFDSIHGLNLGTLINDNGTLKIQPSSGSAIRSQSASSLSSVNYPPTNGYSSDSIEARANTIYLLTTESSDSEKPPYYSKIFIRSINGTSSVVVDYAVQTAVGLTNY